MSDDDTYEIPLQNQRPFGAGIKRQRVRFVPSSANTPSTAPLPSSSGQSVSDLYLKMVLPGDQKPASSSEATLSSNTESALGTAAQICEICNLCLEEFPASAEPDALGIHQTSRRKPHEASLAHQVCLTHSHPPSHLDRNRKGLTYLSAYGWDPDSRRGLGASGQGIQFPIKTKPKEDKMGIGVVLPPEAERKKKVRIQKLDAGKARKMYEQDRKRGERLKEMFYRNDDVERYLGGG
ncbi:hypothetical protein LZ554_003306 [Drepanopeziza brunnea f. sp. 'monogermtubi']|nr:hypothetical protein LZ554_003306 [Drepanopeziza brunnea f. sp. 'monogermtubi']